MAKSKSKSKSKTSTANTEVALRQTVEDAQTPELQKRALDRLNKYRTDRGHKAVSYTDIGTRELTDEKVKGTKTKGTQIGNVREINASKIGDAARMDAARVAPVERAANISLGSTRDYAATTLGPAQQLDETRRNEFRAKQFALAQQLAARAAGQGPSLADLQMREATDRNIKQQMGVLAAQRGISPGLSARLAGNQVGALNQEAARQSAMARLAEQIAAQEQLGSVLATGQQIDIAAAQANQAAANQFALEQARLTDAAAATNAAEANKRQVEQGEIDARVVLANQLAANTAAQNQATFEQDASKSNAELLQAQRIRQAELEQAAASANQGAFNQANISQLEGTTGVKKASIGADATKSAAATQAGADVAVAGINQDTAIITNAQDNATNLAGQQQTSDKRLKKDIESADSDIQGFLDSVMAKKWSYKEPSKDGEGSRYGVIAQDLEKSKVGNQMVKETSRGKVVDFGAGFGLMLAAQANLNKRLEALEKRRG